MTKTTTKTKTYRLGSSSLIHAPGVIAWAINGYAFKRDQTNMMRVVRDGWNVPSQHARQLLSKAVPFTVEGETVVFTVAS